MRKLVLVALSLVAIVIVSIAGVRAYEYWASTAQDRCTFGTVTNDRYREWLTKAGALRERVGPLISSESVEIISGSGRKSEYANNIRFTQLSSGVESIDERIAIVHAMLRAEGFQIRAVLPDSLEPFERAQTLVRYRYTKFAPIGLLYACAIGCEYRVFVAFFLRSRNQPPLPNDRDIPNQFSISYYEPSPESGPFRANTPETVSLTCPPVPSAAWAEQFMNALTR